MKRFYLSLAVAATVLLAGCASSGSYSVSKNIDPFAYDSAYMARVETIAKRRGVDVKWVNPPREVDRQVAQR